METRVQRVGGVLQKFPPAHRAAYVAREIQGLMRRGHQIRRYFVNKRDFAGLQIGAGHHHLEGWLTTDLKPLDLQTVYMDATKRSPFDEGMFDCIVAEHIIEHFPPRVDYICLMNVIGYLEMKVCFVYRLLT